MAYDPNNPKGHYNLDIKVPESVIQQIRDLGMEKSIALAKSGTADPLFVEGARRFYPFAFADEAPAPVEAPAPTAELGPAPEMGPPMLPPGQEPPPPVGAPPPQGALDSSLGFGGGVNIPTGAIDRRMEGNATPDLGAELGISGAPPGLSGGGGSWGPEPGADMLGGPPVGGLPAGPRSPATSATDVEFGLGGIPPEQDKAPFGQGPTAQSIAAFLDNIKKDFRNAYR